MYTVGSGIEKFVSHDFNTDAIFRRWSCNNVDRICSWSTFDI